MKKICFVATIPAVVHAFLREHIQTVAEKYEVTVVCNAEDQFLLQDLKGRFILLPIKRKPAPLWDAIALLQLFLLFRKKRFDLVHTHMPKTGLIGTLAAWMAGVPIRINTFHGEVWATKTGWKRDVLKQFDRFIALLATEILVVSQSQKKFLEREQILPPGKAKLIGYGSVCGVDTTRFYPNEQIGRKMREELSIAHNAQVILFVGRLNREKGVLDLAMAFDRIARHHCDVVLFLVGSEEDVPFARIQEICRDTSDRLYYKCFSATPERYMMLADIYCLPSYREGFGMTIIEAAACAVPAVASRIYGITDAVNDGKTGLLFPSGDVDALTQNLFKLIKNKKLRRHMGKMARQRAIKKYCANKIIAETMSYYDNLIVSQQ